MKKIHLGFLGVLVLGGVIGYFIGINNAPAPAAPAAVAPATTAAH